MKASLNKAKNIAPQKEEDAQSEVQRIISEINLTISI